MEVFHRQIRSRSSAFWGLPFISILEGLTSSAPRRRCTPISPMEIHKFRIAMLHCQCIETIWIREKRKGTPTYGVRTNEKLFCYLWTSINYCNLSAFFCSILVLKIGFSAILLFAVVSPVPTPLIGFFS